MDELYMQSAFDDWWEKVGLPPQHFCYLMFDQYGHFLYTGITVNLRNRLASHHAEKPWIDEVSRVEVERYDTREESKARESHLIAERGPAWNIAENQRLENVVSYFTAKIARECPEAQIAAAQQLEVVTRAYQGGDSNSPG